MLNICHTFLILSHEMYDIQEAIEKETKPNHVTCNIPFPTHDPEQDAVDMEHE